MLLFIGPPNGKVNPIVGQFLIFYAPRRALIVVLALSRIPVDFLSNKSYSALKLFELCG